MALQTTATRYHPAFTYHDTDDVIGQSLALYGEYAQREIDLLTSFMDSRSVVYDVGGNIGVHARAFAAAGAEVWSFEPNPTNFDLLKKNCEDLDRVHLVEAAVGDHMGQSTIWEFDAFTSGNYGHLRSGRGGRVCHLISLDSIDAPDPDIIKIDVEGQEFAVLRGAESRIRRNRPLVLFEAQEVDNFGAIVQWFQDLDYRLDWLLVMNYDPKNFRRNTTNVFGDTAIFSVLARPPGFADLGLDPVQGIGDTWQAYCDRVNAGLQIRR